jgi:hypothetical protein
VLADLACVIAGGARAISDFRVLADQKEAFGQVASVPTAYRAPEEIAAAGSRQGGRPDEDRSSQRHPDKLASYRENEPHFLQSAHAARRKSAAPGIRRDTVDSLNCDAAG